MRQDFRVKADISKIYKDARQYSWVFIDSSKILYVSQLAEHVQRLFDIKNPFHLLSRCDGTYFFLPFEEDVRILENNDTVIIVPGTGISNSLEVESNESNQQCSQGTIKHQATNQNQNGFLVPHVSVKEKSNNEDSEKSYVSEKSMVQNDSLQNSIENTSRISFTGSLYRTALHETIADDDTKDDNINEELTEDNSIIEDSTTESKKRKRVRKRRKKAAEIVAESDTSLMDTSGKKPKIINSITISSGKHIRFQGLDNEDNSSENNALIKNNVHHLMQSNGIIKHTQPLNKDLSALLNLRQSSTPLPFQYKRVKRDYKPEIINETAMGVDTTTAVNNSNGYINSSKSMVEPESIKDKSMSNKNAADETVSFKVYRIGEDYTPQISSIIIANVLSTSSDGSQYTMKILHGKEQLEVPEGKFALPKDEEHENAEEDNIVVLDKSTLLELKKVSAIGTPA